MFGAAVYGIARYGLQPCHGRGDNDVPPLLGDELRQDGSYGVQDSFDIDIYHIHPVVYFQF